MEKANVNSTGQILYFTLKEAVKHFTSSFTDYLVILTASSHEENFAFIPVVNDDNARYTKITLATNADDALNGSILAERAGQFKYEIYGQNSATNLDPEDAVVVGLLEQGIFEMVDSTDYTEEHNITLENVEYHHP